MKLICTSGEVTVEPGDRFKDRDLEWEIVGYAGTWSYSSSTVALDLICKPLGVMPSWFKRYARQDGTLVWCSDSVAAKLLTVGDGKPRDARGGPLTPLNQLSDGWLVMEVASLLDTPGYIMMSETEREREGYPSSRDQRVDFIASRREADAFLANPHS